MGFAIIHLCFYPYSDLPHHNFASENSFEPLVFLVLSMSFILLRFSALESSMSSTTASVSYSQFSMKPSKTRRNDIQSSFPVQNIWELLLLKLLILAFSLSVPENMARFGTQKEASRTKSIKFPFPFIFLGIVFYQIVGLQVGQAEALWPRDTYGEYKRIELWRSKHLSHLISISSYGCTRKFAKHGKSIRVRESVRS